MDRYLGLYEQRIRAGQTGSAWQLNAMQSMQGLGTRDEQLKALTEAMFRRQALGKPVGEWLPIQPEEMPN